MTANPPRVLVARPEPQASALCRLIEQYGWQAVSFPSIEIQSQAFQLPRPINDYDFLIYTSVHAVERLPTPPLSDTKSCRVFAIGQTTAEALRKQGCEGVEYPSGAATSEGLLAEAAFQEDTIAGQRVLLITGIGGRTTIVDTLGTRGAKLDRLTVYRRAIPCYDAGMVQRCWQPKPEVMVLTSVDVANNLLTITAEHNLQEAVLSTPSIVLSKRIRESLLEQGFDPRIMVTEESSNQGILNCLTRSKNEVLYE